jgi:fatty-acid peroxygenase
VRQGGGDPALGHRCAGEVVTLELMLRALRFLVMEIDYAVPDRDLALDCSRLPALPRSGFVLRDVRLRAR